MLFCIWWKERERERDQSRKIVPQGSALSLFIQKNQSGVGCCMCAHSIKSPAGRKCCPYLPNDDSKHVPTCINFLFSNTLISLHTIFTIFSFIIEKKRERNEGHISRLLLKDDSLCPDGLFWLTRHIRGHQLYHSSFQAVFLVLFSS